MENLNIRWSKIAIRQHQEIIEWYHTTLGQKAASKYINDFERTLEIASKFPLIGLLDERRSNNTYKHYSILIHPKYRLIYRFDSSTLFVEAIHCTLMK